MSAYSPACTAAPFCGFGVAVPFTTLGTHSLNHDHPGDEATRGRLAHARTKTYPPCVRRADKGGVLHAGIGKVSFAVEKLRENLGVLASAVVAARPKRAKGANFGGYVQKARRMPSS